MRLICTSMDGKEDDHPNEALEVCEIIPFVINTVLVVLRVSVRWQHNMENICYVTFHAAFTVTNQITCLLLSRISKFRQHRPWGHIVNITQDQKKISYGITLLMTTVLSWKTTLEDTKKVPEQERYSSSCCGQERWLINSSLTKRIFKNIMIKGEQYSVQTRRRHSRTQQHEVSFEDHRKKAESLFHIWENPLHCKQILHIREEIVRQRKDITEITYKWSTQCASERRLMKCRLSIDRCCSR